MSLHHDLGTTMKMRPEILVQTPDTLAKLEQTLKNSRVLRPSVTAVFDLLKQYEGWEFFFCYIVEHPAHQILQIAQSGQYDNLASFYAQISHADFWCARVYNSRTSPAWNPLTETFKSYTSKQNKSLYVLGRPCPEITWGDTEYPGTNEIALWLKQR